MRIVEQRHLPALNRYSNKPCLLSILEIAPQFSLSRPAASWLACAVGARLPGVTRLRGLLGTIGAAEPGNAPAGLARLVQAAAIELQRLACDELTMGFVGAVPRMPGRYRLVLPHGDGESDVAARSLALALQLVNALLAGEPFDLPADLAAQGVAADRRGQRGLPRFRRPGVADRRAGSGRRGADRIRFAATSGKVARLAA